MNASEQTRQGVDITPSLQMYIDSLESWKENYKRLLDNSAMSTGNQNMDYMTATANNALENWQNAGAEFFKRCVEDQIELCQFLGHRWERYLDLPQQFSRCRTPAEMGQLQIDFMTRMMTEYTQESAKLMQPMCDLFSKWVSAQRVP